MEVVGSSDGSDMIGVEVLEGVNDIGGYMREGVLAKCPTTCLGEDPSYLHPYSPLHTPTFRKLRASRTHNPNKILLEPYCTLKLVGGHPNSLLPLPILLPGKSYLPISS
jgi:hypothetical protein